MDDPISRIRSLVGESRARDKELRAGFKKLDESLKELLHGYPVRGNSANCSLELYGEDDGYYGFLSFDQGLSVACRTRDEDFRDVLGDESDRIVYSTRSLEECSPVWLRAVGAQEVIDSLLASIDGALQAMLSATARGTKTLSLAVTVPLHNLGSDFLGAAATLKYDDVIQQWQEAQSALGADAAEAATRACRLLETVCKHILSTTGTPLPPADQSIKPLFKSASQALGLTADHQSSLYLKALGSGITTIVDNIGSLRTHRSIAHGTGPHSTPLTFSEARLSVNAAGVLATFLMDSLRQRVIG